MTQTPDPAQMAQAIQGLSEDELRTEIENMGPDTVLRNIFEGMEEAYRPERAKGTESTIQYDIKTSQGTKQWTVQMTGDKCTTSEGPAEDPRLTLETDIVDFVRLIFGQAQGPQLFMTGKLKLKGDMMFAMQMQNFFDRPA